MKMNSQLRKPVFSCLPPFGMCLQMACTIIVSTILLPGALQNYLLQRNQPGCLQVVTGCHLWRLE